MLPVSASGMGESHPRRLPNPGANVQTCDRPTSPAATQISVPLADGTHTLDAWRRRVVNAEESFDAPNHPADRSGDDGADWASDTKPFSRAVFEPTRKAPLGLSCDRRRQGCNDDARIQD